MFLMDSTGPLALAALPTCMISVAIECLSAVAPQVPTLWLLTRCARPAHQMPERTRLGPEQWLLHTWPISTYYYCASTRPRLNFTFIDSLSLSCKDHFSWKWTGSFYVLFTIDWVFPFWNCQCCFFVFWSTLLLLLSLLLLMLYRYFALFQFMCVSMQWSLW